VITWRRHDDDCIRSEDACYWISRAPVMGRMVYTAAWRPQDLKRDGVHLGCHDSGTAAKEACARHAEGSARAVA
jgi:hypothetical protein